MTATDAEAMAEVLSDPSLYHFTGGKPPSVEELQRRYAIQTRGGSADGTERWINELVCLDPDGRPIGYVQATVPTAGGPAEVAWVIGRPWQGNGHATSAARLLVQALADQGATEVMAHIHPEHLASQTVAKRLGLHATDVVVDGETRWQNF